MVAFCKLMVATNFFLVVFAIFFGSLKKFNGSYQTTTFLPKQQEII